MKLSKEVVFWTLTNAKESGGRLTLDGQNTAKQMNFNSFDVVITSTDSACIQTVRLGTNARLDKAEFRLDKPIKLDMGIQLSREFSEDCLDFSGCGRESYRFCWLRVSGFLMELAYRLSAQPANYLLCVDQSIVRLLKATENKVRKQDIPRLYTPWSTVTKHTLQLKDLNYLLNI